jgi:hypothetical protein
MEDMEIINSPCRELVLCPGCAAFLCGRDA